MQPRAKYVPYASRKSLKLPTRIWGLWRESSWLPSKVHPLNGNAGNDEVKPVQRQSAVRTGKGQIPNLRT